AAEPYEGVAVAPDLLVDNRLDQGLRGVLPGYKANRLAIGGEGGRPVAARGGDIAEIGVPARLVGMSKPDQVLLELERAFEDWLGRIGAAELELDAAQHLQRLGHAGALRAVDLLAQARGLDIVSFRRGEITRFLGGETQRIELDAGLLVLGSELADDERQCLLGETQCQSIVARPVKRV